ncbi:MAG: SDR family oxidoreductase [Chitinophagaceae bacterium]|nr:SDR family oxidoreductase [Oligoflexus sp.]
MNTTLSISIILAMRSATSPASADWGPTAIPRASLSAAGVSESAAEMPFFLTKIAVPLFLKQPFLDHENSEILLKRSSLEWLIVRPVMLTNGQVTKTYKIGETFPVGGSMKISRASVAAYIVKSLKE